MKYFVANWKLHGDAALIAALSEVTPQDCCADHVVICPPLTLLADCKRHFIQCEVGAQNCSEYQKGAYTGEVSPQMLKDAGCEYVILGHSERRQHYHEADEMVAAKAELAIEAGLKPIVCVGESLEQRESGNVLAVLEAQVKGSVPASATAKNTILAYEPIWAIGTGKVATILQISEMHEHLKKVSKGIPLLYGGSVKPDNVEEICAVQAVDGVLVGSASINPQHYAAMLAK